MKTDVSDIIHKVFAKVSRLHEKFVKNFILVCKRFNSIKLPKIFRWNFFLSFICLITVIIMTCNKNFRMMNLKKLLKTDERDDIMNQLIGVSGHVQPHSDYRV